MDGMITNQYTSDNYQKTYNQWRNIYGQKRFVGIVLLMIGIVLILIGAITDLHFILDYKGTLDDQLSNKLFWIFLGVLMFIPGFPILHISKFYKDKLSKMFSRGLMEKDPNLLISYYLAVYDLRRSLQNNHIPFNFTTFSILLKRRGTAIRLANKPISIYIVPEYHYSGFRSGELRGVIVSLGPNVSKDDPDVWQLIMLIEQTYTPKSYY